MKGRLASKRVEITHLDVAAEAEPGGQRMVRLQRPVERDSSTVILGHGAAAAPAVVDLLAELGVLP
jgi:electron transfer flavoprotein beta subunit